MNKSYLKLADQIRLNWVQEFPILSEWEYQFLYSINEICKYKMPSEKQIEKLREIYSARRKTNYYDYRIEERELDYTYDEVHDFDRD